jgi:hypothetical protein
MSFETLVGGNRSAVASDSHLCYVYEAVLWLIADIETEKA